jgi:hypothetical protein
MLPTQTSFQPQPLTPPPRSLSPVIDYTKPPKQRLKEAKQWLEDNPTEHCTTASRLFGVTYTSLYSSMKRP